MTNACRDEFALLFVCAVTLACLVGSSQSYPFPLSPAADDRYVLVLDPSYVYRNSASRLYNNVDSLQKWLDRFNDELEKRGEMKKRNIAIGRGDGFRPGK